MLNQIFKLFLEIPCDFLCPKTNFHKSPKVCLWASIIKEEGQSDKKNCHKKSIQSFPYPPIFYDLILKGTRVVHAHISRGFSAGVQKLKD